MLGYKRRDGIMQLLQVLSPLSNFARMIATYFGDIWSFLLFVGTVSSVIVVLVGAILWLTEVNQTRGRALVLSGILLGVVVQYFIVFPPEFILT